MILSKRRQAISFLCSSHITSHSPYDSLNGLPNLHLIISRTVSPAGPLAYSAPGTQACLAGTLVIGPLHLLFPLLETLLPLNF